MTSSDQPFDLFCCLRATAGKIAHFTCHYRKTTPRSPARAASTAAFRARILVWKAIPSYNADNVANFLRAGGDLLHGVSHGTDLDTARLPLLQHFLPVPTPVVRYRRFALPWRLIAPYWQPFVPAMPPAVRYHLEIVIACDNLCYSDVHHGFPYAHHSPSHAKPAAWSSGWQKWRDLIITHTAIGRARLPAAMLSMATDNGQWLNNVSRASTTAHC